MQENNDSNAGAATGGSSDSSDSGSQNANPSVNSGTPDNQNGNQTALRNDDTTRMREEIKRLNQAVVDAKRGNRTNNPSTGSEDNSFDTPEGQYGIAIQLATGNLRNKMEDLISLYPELPAEEISRIRKSPWAFAGHDSFINADWETAALEIEQAMLTRAEEISASKTNQNSPIPADVNSNPVSGAENSVPGNEEGEDLWNMPLNELEMEKNKAVANVSKSK